MCSVCQIKCFCVFKHAWFFRRGTRRNNFSSNILIVLSLRQRDNMLSYLGTIFHAQTASVFVQIIACELRDRSYITERLLRHLVQSCLRRLCSYGWYVRPGEHLFIARVKQNSVHHCWKLYIFLIFEHTYFLRFFRIIRSTDQKVSAIGVA